MSNFLVVMGNDHFLRRRYIHKAIPKKTTVVRLDGSSPRLGDDLDGVFGQALFSDQTVTVLVQNPKEVLPAFEGVPDNVNLLIEFDGEPRSNSKVGKWVSGLPKEKVVTLSIPEKSWDLIPRAEKFFVKELHPLKIDSTLASAAVAKVGTDLGVLSFEALKLKNLLQADSETTVTVSHLKATLTSLLETSLEPLCDAVASRNRTALMKAWQRVYGSSPNDPTIGICYFLGKSAVRWLKVLQVAKEPEDVGAAKVGIHPWVYKTKLLPQAKSIGKRRSRKLLQLCAETERKVKSGGISPQVFLETGLFELLSSSQDID